MRRGSPVRRGGSVRRLSLIAALLLFGLGSGPIKGFAVTLSIGIVTSVFTAYVVTRMITVGWMKLLKPKRFNI